MQSAAVEGPYFDELAIGQDFGPAPGLTLTSGLAAAHQAITGDRLALALDHELCHQVTGGGPLAPPSLVWDAAIGQSTVVTQHVKANLFYRGLARRARGGSSRIIGPAASCLKPWPEGSASTQECPLRLISRAGRQEGR